MSSNVPPSTHTSAPALTYPCAHTYGKQFENHTWKPSKSVGMIRSLLSLWHRISPSRSTFYSCSHWLTGSCSYLDLANGGSQQDLELLWGIDFPACRAKATALTTLQVDLPTPYPAGKRRKWPLAVARPRRSPSLAVSLNCDCCCVLSLSLVWLLCHPRDCSSPGSSSRQED